MDCLTSENFPRAQNHSGHHHLLTRLHPSHQNLEREVMGLSTGAIAKVAKIFDRFQQTRIYALDMAILLGPGVKEERVARRRLTHEKAENGLIARVLGSRGDITTNPATRLRRRTSHGPASSNSNVSGKIALSILDYYYAILAAASPTTGRWHHIGWQRQELVSRSSSLEVCSGRGQTSFGCRQNLSGWPEPATAAFGPSSAFPTLERPSLHYDFRLASKSIGIGNTIVEVRLPAMSCRAPK